MWYAIVVTGPWPNGLAAGPWKSEKTAREAFGRWAGREQVSLEHNPATLVAGHAHLLECPTRKDALAADIGDKSGKNRFVCNLVSEPQ